MTGSLRSVSCLRGALRRCRPRLHGETCASFHPFSWPQPLDLDDELPRFVSGTELANGFVNRFLLVSVKRSRNSRSAAGSTAHNSSASATRPSPRCESRACPASCPSTPRPGSDWARSTGPLSRGEEGLLGAATGRAEAHVVRLAAIYATLDTSKQITGPHLEAALAVWRYSLDSARCDLRRHARRPTADEIWALAKDRPAGVTRSEVRDLFSRNKKPARSTAPSPSSKSRTPHPHQHQRRPRPTRRDLATPSRLTAAPSRAALATDPTLRTR